MTHHYYYTPTNLDLDQLIEKYPPFEGFKKDVAQLFISQYYEVNSYDYKRSHAEDGFVRLHSKRLEKIGIRNAKDYRYWLIEAGVFNVNEQYFRGEVSKRFKLAEKYLTNDIATVPITNKTICRNKNRLKIQQDKIKIEAKFLRRWFDSKKLEINKTAAEQYNRDKYIYNLNSCQSITDERKRLDKIAHHTASYYSGVVNINKIATNDYHFTIDTTVGRLHTNLSTISSDLRYFITYDGYRLLSIDVKNSQPFLSVLILDKRFWMNPFTNQTLRWDELVALKIAYDKNQSKSSRKNVTDEYVWENSGKLLTITEENFKKLGCFLEESDKNAPDNSLFYDYTPINQPSKINFLSFLPYLYNFISPSSFNFSTIMFSKITDLLDNADVEHYRDIVCSGKLYEYLGEEVKKRKMKGFTLNDDDKLRKEMKEVIFTVFFSPNKYKVTKTGKLPKTKALFKELFPSVYNVFELLKTHHHECLPIMLQIIEKEIILERVAKRISKEKPRLPIFTIHDSVATLHDPSAVSYVKQVINDEMQEVIGSVPILKEEPWCPSKLKSFV